MRAGHTYLVRHHCYVVGSAMSINVRLLQISDSALPISGYTHSWCLVAAISRGLVHDAESLEGWTRNWLRATVGPFEGVLVASSCRATAASDTIALQELNGLLEASIVPGSTRRASREMGGQLLKLGATWVWSAPRLASLMANMGEPAQDWHHAIAFGLLGAIAQGDRRTS